MPEGLTSPSQPRAELASAVGTAEVRKIETLTSLLASVNPWSTAFTPVQAFDVNNPAHIGPDDRFAESSEWSIFNRISPRC